MTQSYDVKYISRTKGNKMKMSIDRKLGRFLLKHTNLKYESAIRWTIIWLADLDDNYNLTSRDFSKIYGDGTNIFSVYISNRKKQKKWKKLK